MEKQNISSICFHHEYVHGNVFEGRTTQAAKCCGVLIEHRRKVKGERVITLELAQQLQSKNVHTVPGLMLCRQCVNCASEATAESASSDTDEEDMLLDNPVDDHTQAIHDSDEDFVSIYETSREKLNTSLETVNVSPINLHAVPQHSRVSCAQVKLSKFTSSVTTSLADAYGAGLESLKDSNLVEQPNN